jgi:hypothetical protein
MFVVSVLIAAGAAAPGAVSSANPLARAEQGELQCYRPDVAKKSCQSIASYQPTAPGTYDNKAIIAVSSDATLETHTPVVLKGEAVCGYIRAEDMNAGTLRLRGNIVAPDAARPVLQKIAQSVAQFAGKEVCTRYEPSGTDFTAKVSIAGIYRPDQDVKVRWIGRLDGYTVTP